MTLPLPGFRQARSYTCGFASALMVLHYFDAGVGAMELFRQLRTDRGGTRQNALIREFRAAGLRVNARYDVDFARIGQAIDRGKLIVGYLADLEHWLVIYGYGLAPRRVFVADPRPDQPCEQPWDDYRERLGGFGIICSGPQAVGGARQTGLELREPEHPPAKNGPPPLPVSQLRCEVHQLDASSSESRPVQLRLPFSA